MQEEIKDERVLRLELMKILIPSRNISTLKMGEEGKLCIAFANFLRQLTLKGDFPFVWFHIANEGSHYNPVFGLKLGWMGRVPGVADYCFVGLNGNRSFFIEFKSKTGQQSPAQKTFEYWCKQKQIDYFICRTLESGCDIINSKIELSNR